jgi:outer membrane lipoprotein-sorting protein
MLKEWRINPGLDEKIFTFTPPFGAKEVELKKSVDSKTVK